MVKRIVLADDSVTIQKAFAMTFGGEDVTLMAARSADEGLSLARQVRPDLVIADGVMPGRSGYELCTAIKSDPALQATAVYILSSTHQPYDEERGRQSGSDGHLVKPFDTNAIIEQVREALAKGPSGARPVAPAARPTPTPMPMPPSPSQISAGATDDDEYGELVVDVPEPEGAPAPAAVPALAVRPAASQVPIATGVGAAVVAAPSGAGMRPSLIPGVRPGTLPLTRPGAQVRPMGPGSAPAPTVPSRTTAQMSRTLMGVPAANMPIPGTTRAVSGPAARTGVPPAAAGGLRPSAALPASVSISPAISGSGVLARPGASAGASPAGAALVSSIVDQKVAAFAAKGPEYEAIAKLSREIIEQIAWEIVPELAEAILREQAEKRGPR